MVKAQVNNTNGYQNLIIFIKNRKRNYKEKGERKKK